MAVLVSRSKVNGHRNSKSSDAAGQPSHGSLFTFNKTPIGTAPQAATARGPTRISLDHSAFHVSRGGTSRGSNEAPIVSDSTIKTNDQAVSGGRVQKSQEDPQTIAQDAIPARASSKGGVDVATKGAHNQNQNRSRNPPTETTADLVPARGSSKQIFPKTHERKVTGGRIVLNLAEDEPQAHVIPRKELPNKHAHKVAPSHDDSHHSLNLRRVFEAEIPPSNPSDQGNDRSIYGVEDKTERAEPVAVDMSRTASTLPNHVSDQMDHDRDRDLSQKAAIAASYVSFPEGFDMQNTVRTEVTEEQRPAVIHENVIKQKTEIRQKAITRDIHVHHYYTYIQPVKVVEILPAKHFILDPRTGVKTEIPAPPGWQLPNSLSPVLPDTSTVKGWTRHYLVDEEHPNGVLEPPPPNHEPNMDGLEERAKRA